MVTVVEVSTHKDVPMQMYGLSTDNKPTTIGDVTGSTSTDALPNGSCFIEMDSGLIYFYDAANERWREF